MIHSRHAHRQEGFTLIDTLLGVAIFLVISSAIFSLVFTTMNASHGIIERQKAANLAREGIEIMENIRNTHILRGVSWASKPDNSQTYPADTLWKVPFSSLVQGNKELCITATFAKGNLPWQLKSISCPTGSSLPSETSLSQSTFDGEEVWVHAGGDTFPKRYIKLTNITGNLSSSIKTSEITPHPSKADTTGQDDILLIESIVQWENKGSIEEEKLQKILTKWE